MSTYAAALWCRLENGPIYSDYNHLYKTNGKSAEIVKDGEYFSLNIYKNKLYAIGETGSIVKMDLDGSSMKTVESDHYGRDTLSTTSRLAVYKNKIYVFWSDYGVEGKVEIESMNLNGGQRQTVAEFSTHNSFGCDTVCIDDDKIYYLDYANYTVYAINLDGSQAKQIIDLNTLGYNANKDEEMPFSMYIEGQRVIYGISPKKFGVYNLKTKKNVTFRVPKGEEIYIVNHDGDFQHYEVISVAFVDLNDNEEASRYRYYVWQYDANGRGGKMLYSYQGYNDGYPYLYVTDNGLFVKELSQTVKAIDPKTGKAMTLTRIKSSNY